MRKNVIEKIKSAFIVVLFSATILLLYLVLGGAPALKLSDIIHIGAKPSVAPAASDVVQPRYVAYGSGDGAFSLAFGSGGSGGSGVLTSKTSLANEGVKRFKTLSEQSSVLVSEISEEQYISALTGYESCVFAYSYSLPFSEFCGVFGIKISGTMGNVDRITAFAFSGAAQDSVLLVDSVSNKFYRLLSDGTALGEIELFKTLPGSAASFSDEKYYFAKDVLGAGGRKLIPIGEALPLLPIKGEPEFGKNSSQSRLDVAEKVFGDTFDFVRRIEDGFGNITYMYGYGAKTLTLRADGGLEYRAESGSGRSGGWFADLQTALEYISEIGGWESKGDASFELVGADQTNEDGKQKRTFYFSQFADGAELCREEGQKAISVSVEKGKVVYYSRNAVNVRLGSGTWSSSVIDAVNTIAANSSTPESFNFIAENFESIRKCYFYNDGKFTPSWKLTLADGSEYYYDLGSGKELK